MMAGRKISIAIALLVWCLACATAVPGEDAMAEKVDGSKMAEPAAAAAYDGYGQPGKNMFYETLGQAPAQCPDWCSCTKELAYSILSSENGCAGPNSCTGSGYGGGWFCSGSQTSDQTRCGFSTFYPNNNVAFCISTAALCVKAECPRSGQITIKAEGVEADFPAIFPNCCFPPDMLYVYRGDYDASAVSTSSNVLAWDQRDVDITVDCARGDVFTVCEKDGFILLDRVSFTHSTIHPDGCPTGYNAAVCSSQ